MRAGIPACGFVFCAGFPVQQPKHREPHATVRLRLFQSRFIAVRRGVSGDANNVRRKNNQDFVFFVFDVVLREEVTQNRNSSETRPSGDAVSIRALDQPAHHADFSVFQAHIVIDDFLADHGLIDSANVYVAADGGDFNFDLERDVAVAVNFWSEVYVDAHVLILELCVYEGIDEAGARGGNTDACTCLKASSRDWYAGTNFQDAFSPSTERISGFSRTLVVLSVRSAVTVALGSATT